MQWPKSHQVPIFTEEDPTYDDLTETNSLASGSVNEILDGIADVQEFRDSILLDQHPFLDDLTIPDHIESRFLEILQVWTHFNPNWTDVLKVFCVTAVDDRPVQ